MSRAVIYEAFGAPNVSSCERFPEPNAAVGEVRVRVRAAGLNPMNPMDWGIAARPEVAARFGITVPSGFGSDLVGVIDEAGDGTTGFAAGDRARSQAAPSVPVCWPGRQTRDTTALCCPPARTASPEWRSAGN